MDRLLNFDYVVIKNENNLRKSLFKNPERNFK